MLPECPVNTKRRKTVLYTVVAVSIILILSCGKVSRRVLPDVSLVAAEESPANPGLEKELRRNRHSIVLNRMLSPEERYEPSNGFILLQTEGDGFYHYEGTDRPYTDAWGTPETIKCVENVGKTWAKRYPDRPRIGVGDISRRKGGKFPPHHAHRLGLDIDVRPISKLGEKKVSIGQHAYDSQQTFELIALFLEICDVRLMYFNDRKIYRKLPKVQRFRGHHNHIHITLKAPPKTHKAPSLPPYQAVPNIPGTL